jgi:hypothetical protein
MILETDEIKILAEDVKENINQTLDITKFAVTASCTILGFSFAGIVTKNMLSPLICILPIPILCVALEMILNRRLNIMKKATFLRRFGGNKYRWEKYLYYKRITKEGEATTKDSFTRTLYVTLLTIALVSIIAAVVMEIGPLILLWKCLKTHSFCDIAHSYCDIKNGSDTFLNWIVFGLMLTTILFSIYYFVSRGFKLKEVQMGGSSEERMFRNWSDVEETLRE